MTFLRIFKFGCFTTKIAVLVTFFFFLNCFLTWLIVLHEKRRMKRKFNEDGIMHIYQRTISGFNIFYCIEDFIVFYTIVSVYASKFKIILIALCQMIDHTHLLASCGSLEQMSRFISAYTSGFVREFNQFTGRKGPLFKKVCMVYHLT